MTPEEFKVVVDDVNRVLRAVRYVMLVTFIAVLGLVIFASVTKHDQEDRKAEHKQIISAIAKQTADQHALLIKKFQAIEAGQDKEIAALRIELQAHLGTIAPKQGGK